MEKSRLVRQDIPAKPILDICGQSLYPQNLLFDLISLVLCLVNRIPLPQKRDLYQHKQDHGNQGSEHRLYTTSEAEVA